MPDQVLRDSVPPPNSTSSNDLAVVIQNDGALAEFLENLVDLNDDGVFYSPDCDICSCAKRAKLEAIWLKSRDVKQVKVALTEIGLKVPETVVRNHMEHHIDRSYLELRKREYIAKILSLSETNLGTLERLEITLSAISERLISINAVEDGAVSPATLEKIKADTTVKLAGSLNSLLQLRADLLGEMRKTGEVFTIRQEDFVRIMDNALNQCSTGSERYLVTYIMTEFGKASGSA